MFTTAGKAEAATLTNLVAIYLAGAAYYFVYQLCGKYKPWWVLLAQPWLLSQFCSVPPASVYHVFRNVLPGRLPTASESVSFPEILVDVFGAGLMEELLKALPVMGRI